MAKCPIEDTKCAKDCAKTCDGKDYSLDGPTPSELKRTLPKLNRKTFNFQKTQKLNETLPKLNKKRHKLNKKRPKLNKKPPKLNKKPATANRKMEKIPIHGADFSYQMPVDASAPIVANDMNFITGMNCPCFAKCNKMEGRRKDTCEVDCDKECSSK